MDEYALKTKAAMSDYPEEAPTKTGPTKNSTQRQPVGSAAARGGAKVSTSQPRGSAKPSGLLGTKGSENIQLPSSRPQPKDTQHLSDGTSQLNIKAGKKGEEDPKHKNFGKIPKYIQKF